LSDDRYFETVTFFDRTPEQVTETLKRLPGASGFPANFADVVLATPPPIYRESALSAPENEPDTESTRKAQIVADQHWKFRGRFPFDVINLDYEEYAFKPRDKMPGEIINCLRQVAEWQHTPLVLKRGNKRREVPLDSFSLMFTTRLGPRDLAAPYEAMLTEILDRNVSEDDTLIERMERATGNSTIQSLKASMFDEFFILGITKSIARILMDHGWYVDDATGIEIFKFHRGSDGAGYDMIHLVMNVVRQTPPVSERAPGSPEPEAARRAYRNVARNLFDLPINEVTAEIVSAATLDPTLEQVFAERRSVYSP